MVLLNIWNPPQRVLADSFGVNESEHVHHAHRPVLLVPTPELVAA
jgi:hypothetical protein